MPRLQTTSRTSLALHRTDMTRSPDGVKRPLAGAAIIYPPVFTQTRMPLNQSYCTLLSTHTVCVPLLSTHTVCVPLLSTHTVCVPLLSTHTVCVPLFVYLPSNFCLRQYDLDIVIFSRQCGITEIARSSF